LLVGELPHDFQLRLRLGPGHAERNQPERLQLRRQRRIVQSLRRRNERQAGQTVALGGENQVLADFGEIQRQPLGTVQLNLDLRRGTEHDRRRLAGIGDSGDGPAAGDFGFRSAVFELHAPAEEVEHLRGFALRRVDDDHAILILHIQIERNAALQHLFAHIFSGEQLADRLVAGRLGLAVELRAVFHRLRVLEQRRTVHGNDDIRDRRKERKRHHSDCRRNKKQIPFLHRNKAPLLWYCNYL